jgi:hypothetical protein
VWSEKLASRLAAATDFRVTTSPMLSLFSFRHEPKNIADLDGHNLRLINAINDDGRIYLTQTRVDGQFVIRFQACSFDLTEADADEAFDVIVEIALQLDAERNRSMTHSLAVRCKLDLMIWRRLVLRICIRPLHGAFALLAIMDIRPHPISFSDRP